MPRVAFWDMPSTWNRQSQLTRISTPRLAPLDWLVGAEQNKNVLGLLLTISDRLPTVLAVDVDSEEQGRLAKLFSRSTRRQSLYLATFQSILAVKSVNTSVVLRTTDGGKHSISIRNRTVRYCSMVNSQTESTRRACGCDLCCACREINSIQDKCRDALCE